ncbi:hypothetical protein [Geotalea uraniireducens]|nr:hypothetical protein [Geotalea uraniireducens]
MQKSPRDAGFLISFAAFYRGQTDYHEGIDTESVAQESLAGQVQG